MKERNFYFYDRTAVGQRIKTIRESFHCTMEQFGQLIGTTKVAVYNWETGKRLPSNDSLKWIAILGKTTVEWLVYGDVDEYILSLVKIDTPLYMQVKTYYADHYAGLFEQYEKATTETRKDVVTKVISDYKQKELLIYSELPRILNSFIKTMKNILSKRNAIELSEEIKKSSLSEIKKKKLSAKEIDSLLESIRNYLEH